MSKGHATVIPSRILPILSFLRSSARVKSRRSERGSEACKQTGSREKQ